MVDIEEIRSIIRADAFRPFRLRLADGRVREVSERYRLGVAPTNRYVFWADETGFPVCVKPDDIASIEFVDALGRNGAHA